MSLSEMMLPEFDQEMAATRRVLERVPQGDPDWRPHEKSMTMAHLASHLAEMPRWLVGTLRDSSMDIAPKDGEPYTTRIHTDREALLAAFDANVAAGREALAAASDETMGESWSLLSGGEPMFSLPKVAVIRGMILNHLIHHRGQLSVYLRLNEVPVPAVYGPSADEAPQ